MDYVWKEILSLPDENIICIVSFYTSYFDYFCALVYTLYSRGILIFVPIFTI